MSSNLIEVYQNLVEVEKEMRLMYGELLEKLSNEEVKNVIAVIAVTEERHRNLMEEALSILKRYSK